MVQRSHWESLYGAWGLPGTCSTRSPGGHSTLGAKPLRRSDMRESKHPGYGPCDAMLPNGACSECFRNLFGEARMMREFDTGATRDTEEGKLDYEGFLSPAVLKRFAEYMHQHRVQADGKLRASDNWQKGIPKEAYAKSLWRHFMDFWGLHRAVTTPHGQDAQEDALCAMLFNIQGYLHELLKEKNNG